MRSPKYRKHSSRDFAFVEWQGQRHRLPGLYGSVESRDAYRLFVERHVHADKPISIPRPKPDPQQITVWEVATRFLRHAKTHYRGAGEYDNCKHAVAQLKQFAILPASEFGPLRLKAVQQAMIDGGASVNYINAQCGRIRRCFRWAASEELVPASLWHGLQSVAGLRAGRTAAVVHPKRKPVPWKHVEPVMAELSPTVAAMVWLQWFTSVRSKSICNATPAQFQRRKGAALWYWRPQHKTEHRGVELVVPIGPQCQKILLPFLDRRPDEPLFSPQEAGSSKRYGKRYTRFSYRQAIRRAQERAGVPLWSPHQLRHARATQVREAYGVEGAQAILGHETLAASQIYAARRYELAERIALEVG